MDNNESTIFDAAKQQPKNNQQKQASGRGWQQVTIGGATGILMGAAGMYAARAWAGEQTADEGIATAEAATATTQSHTAPNGLHVAEVDQNLSFGEAFEAARAEVGPGGVFHWHGGIYNTYTAQEWSSMSSDEHQQFAQQVKPEVRPGEEHTGQSNAAHHDTAQQTSHDDSHRNDEQGKPEPQPVKPEGHNEPEVHFLGVEQVQTESGQTMNVGHMTIGQQEVALVDMDDNQVFDVAISDRNANGQIDDNEVLDISDRQLTVTDFAIASAQQPGNGPAPQPDVANNETPQDHLADGMPDYMDDADVQTI